jgi:putative membrane protein
MKTRWVTTAAAVMALAFAPAVTLAQQSSAPAAEKKAKVPSGETKFIESAYQDNLAEVELGKLASERGASDSVKKFGQRMVDDHGKANEELAKLAHDKGVSTPSGLDGRHQKLRDRLAKLSSSDFDRAYAGEMLKGHRKDVKEFQRAADRGKDPDVKTYASKTLPVLQEHLKQAEDMHAQVKGSVKAAKK